MKRLLAIFSLGALLAALAGPAWGVTISDFPEESSPSGTDVVPVQDGVTTSKMTLATLAANLPAITTPSINLTGTPLAHEYGGLEADLSGYDGLIRISGGATSQISLPLGVQYGGWGLNTLTQYSLYTGNGTGSPVAIGVGSNNQVLVGNTGAAPSWSSNPSVPFAAKTADYTLTATDKVISVDATGAETTINLPAASGIAGRCYTIKKIDSSANAVVLDGNGAETIDGSANYRISLQWQAVTVISDGTNWLVI